MYYTGLFLLSHCSKMIPLFGNSSMTMVLTQQKQKLLLIIAMGLALGISFVDQTAVPIALPSMQRSFHASGTMLQWIVNAYLLALASLVVFGGKVGDMLGQRKVFLSGLSLFMLASICCALAPGALWIIFARAIQGIGGAFMIPQVAPMLLGPFAANERGRAIGTYVSLAAIFLALGPLLGGMFSQYFSWHWIFWINLPLAIVCAILTIITVPKKLHQEIASKLDIAGLIFLVIAMSSLVFALMEAANYGWTSAFILSCFVIAIIALTLFLIVENKTAAPLVELKVFRNVEFSAGWVVLLIMQGCGTIGVFWTIYFQDVIGLKPAFAGLIGIAPILPLIFMGRVNGLFIDKKGPRLVTSIGSILLILSASWSAIFIWHENYWLLLVGLLLYGFGVPMIISSTMTMTLSAVPVHQRGSASGLMNGARQLGAALGLAVFGSIISNINHLKLSAFLQTQTAIFQHLKIQQISGILSGGGKNQTFMHQLSASDFALLLAKAKSVFTFGFFYVILIMLLAGFGILILSRKYAVRITR